MKPLRFFLLTVMTAALCLSSVAGADDGAIINKEMSRTIKVPVFDQDLVNEALPEAEHAFTDMMEFYVPAQKASGAPAGDDETGYITYCNIDNQVTGSDTEDSGAPADCDDSVEELPVAKPLVNVFLFGPQFEVPHTAFAHRWFDTYAAVSLDDGLTWKQTNLSESADKSSFNIEEDHKPSNKDPLPSDHNIVLPEDVDAAFRVPHAKGYDTPYTAHCAECHGQGLQGVAEVPSCYSCHDAVWSEESPLEIGPTITQADFVPDKDNKDKGYLEIEGVNAVYKAKVIIINAVTGGLVGEVKAEFDGSFVFEVQYKDAGQPCVVAAEYTDNDGEILIGPSLSVTDPVTHEPIENCTGLPVDLADYPGGSYNVFQATAGNKTLVAWPSRYCEQGQAGYTLTTTQNEDRESEGDNNALTDDQKAAKLAAITNLIRDGDVEGLGLAGLPEFTSTIDGDAVDDLYLVDAFGVKGSQGSIDFAEEGYPQAGIVPFGCVWTARGVLLPGDDPRTDEYVEQSHMVWTKAERLTSGRRDVNRIEVHGVKGAGFVITWQEDPEGLRPGQGLGPGEGWSGAVAHSQTDAWYSFINEEYFDIVEDTVELDANDNPVPKRIQDVNLDTETGGTGRPKVFVPMAVPMRLSNNAKCKPADAETSGNGIPAVYCTYDDLSVAGEDGTTTNVLGAYHFGLKDNCADTVTITTGNAENNPQETAICVADSNGDGTADLPNRANTALTRPRTSLQSYNASDTDKSAWVIVAAEESKGLGKYFFEPDGLLNGGDDYADPCVEDSTLTCTEEIGKNQWYFSFDMGTPDTSAGIGEPNSLVENLVSQGNMLNQGEVYWETGELFGLMKTEDMEDYGEYNFEILNTEIARRSSLLVQGVNNAVNSRSHLAAIASWKQGNMRQGGPADTMLRRFVLPVDYDNEACPAVGADQPVITSAVLVKEDDKFKLEIEGTGADGLSSTEVLFRNAVTGTPFDSKDTLKDDDDGNFTGKVNKPAELPCAIQAADEGDPQYGPWIAVEGAEGQCVGAIPVGCIPSGGSFVESIENNPYAFENMECETFLIEAGTNPYYPGGVCADPAINLSGVTPDTCINDGDDPDFDGCPVLDCTTDENGVETCIGGTNPILQGYIQNKGNTMRVLTWHQCPSAYTGITSEGVSPVACLEDETNLDDQSWYNPLDVSKGHRGFLDGDFVMFLYGWSPNWRLNAKGHDRYDLYVRRSFDGGQTWTTTPGSFTASNGESYTGYGTVTCERYRPELTQLEGDRIEPTACYQFEAGAAEHARNVTQHRALRITTLDPRFAKAGGPRGVSIMEGCTDGLFAILPEEMEGSDGSIFTCDDESVDYDSDLRDPSRYFMVYEVGDNRTVEEGEAEPLDLYYSRAEGFGDDYVVWTETDTESANLEDCYPTVSYGDEDLDVALGVALGSGFCNEFDRMNTAGDTHSSEANLVGNPDASKLYGVWSQWVFADDEDYESEIVESAAKARRIWWIDDYVSDNLDLIYTLPGTQNPNE